MSRTLGSFGVLREALDVDFDYFGTMIRINPDFSMRAMAPYMKTAAAFDEKNPDFDLMDELADAALRVVIHPEDFDAFKALAAAQRQEAWDLIEVASQLIEAVTEVPTVRPSGSSDGPNSTGPSSEVVSSSPVVTRLEEAGRPDLALVVVRSQEFLSA